MATRKLFRSRTDMVIAGVCGGLGRYLGVDSTWVRLFFAFMAFYNFLGVWAYLVLALVMPAGIEGEAAQPPVPLNQNPEATRVVGGGLLVLGTLALLSTVRAPWVAWFSLDKMWPMLLILMGGLLLMRAFMAEE